MSVINLGDVAERNAARLGQGRLAICHDEMGLTWGELAAAALRRAHGLKGAGIAQDDIVALALPNGNALYEFTFATWKLGATPMPVSPRLPPAELQAVLIAAGAKKVIAQDPALLSDGALPASLGADMINPPLLPSRTAKHWKVMTSGGSTGRPKVIVDHNPSRLAPPDGLLFLPRDGVILNPGPLYHNFPFALTHMGMVGGATVIGMPKFDAEKVLTLIERHRVQWINLVPTMMDRIMRLPADVRARYDLSSLATVWHTAAPIPAWLKEQWIDWIGPERLWEMYGGSEGFCTTQLNGDEWLVHRGSVGRPTVGKVTIRDENGDIMPPGQVGEIYMRGPSGAAPTYHYLGAESRRLSDGFESLGDFGWLDEEGYLYIADRRTDLIICGGENVYPAEVEAALMEHPLVQTAVVIGLPDADLGAVPHAIVQPEADLQPPTERALREYLADRLTRFKLPRSYEFTTAPLRDEAGKVRRSRLRTERLQTMS